MNRVDRFTLTGHIGITLHFQDTPLSHPRHVSLLKSVQDQVEVSRFWHCLSGLQIPRHSMPWEPSASAVLSVANVGKYCPNRSHLIGLQV